MKDNRLSDIDKLKGLAIFLVVLGHVVAREPPAQNEWFVELVETIYLFHMPLFMFLSGLILAYTRKPILNLNDYGRYVVGKFKRLMPAYLIFSLIVFIGKMCMGRFVHVDNIAPSWFSYFDVIINPLSSYCAYLWYIYVLFLFYAIAPIVYYATRQRIEYLLPICLLLHFVELPGYFGLSSLGEYAFVFFLGCTAGEYYAEYSKFLERYGALFVTPFVIALFFATTWEVPKFVMGLISIPACQALVGIRWVDSWSLLRTLSYYTFPIYLMNTLFIGVTKGVMFKFASWDGVNFIWFAPTLFVAGILGPIIASELYERRRQYLARKSPQTL